MKKAALNAYLVNNNLDVSGVYGYYEFNTGRKTFLYNNYYSGDQSPVLFSITGLFVDEGGALYTNSDVGTIYSKSGEHKDIPFRVNVNVNGTITSAYIDAGNTGGNVSGNVVGGVGTGLYYETPTTFVASTNGEQAIIDPIMYPNYDYGTRYDLNPLVSLGPSTGAIKSALDGNLGSGHFSGRDCLRFSSGFSDDNWTMFIDCKIDKAFALGKAKVLLTSYENWTGPSGFAVTIDDSFHLNFEYRDSLNQVQSFNSSVDLQEFNLISISKDSGNSSVLLGRHNLSEEKHSFDKILTDYTSTKNLYIGGAKSGIYSNACYTGFSGYINEILFLNQSCNSEQLTELSHLFSITGYQAPSSGVVTSYYPLVTGVNTSTEIIATSGVVGYQLESGDYDGGTGYVPSGIISGIVETGIIIYYDPINSGQTDTLINIPEQFYYDAGSVYKYAENFISFETNISSEDILEFYSFNSFNPITTSDFQVNFSSSPGKVYFNSGVSGVNFNLYENGVYQVSGLDYDYYEYRNLVDSNKYKPYSNSKEEESFVCSLPNSGYSVSGFAFSPSAGSNYTYSNFPFSLDNNTGYLLYLNGQKLVPGASYDYYVSSNNLIINNASNNFETGNINIAGIRSGISRNYTNAYGTYGSNLLNSGFSYRLIDEMIFLNGQRLKNTVDYVKTSSGKLNIRTSVVPACQYLFFSGQTGFFNV